MRIQFKLSFVRGRIDAGKTEAAEEKDGVFFWLPVPDSQKPTPTLQSAGLASLRRIKTVSLWRVQ